MSVFGSGQPAVRWVSTTGTGVTTGFTTGVAIGGITMLMGKVWPKTLYVVLDVDIEGAGEAGTDLDGDGAGVLDGVGAGVPAGVLVGDGEGVADGEGVEDAAGV